MTVSVAGGCGWTRTLFMVEAVLTAAIAVSVAANAIAVAWRLLASTEDGANAG